MRTIATFLTDKSFLIKILGYLEAHYGIRTVVVDKDGEIDALDGRKICELPEKRFYRVPFQEDIGGLRCSAETTAILELGDPHIQIWVDGLERLVDRSVILQQTMDEMLRLSEQLHFLFGLANKLAGVQDVQQYCLLVLKEISQAVNADSAFVYIKDKKNKPQVIPFVLSAKEAKLIYWDQALKSLPVGKTAIVSLEDGSSALAAPIMEKEAQIGHVIFLKKAKKHVFTAYEKQFVGIINSIVCPTMETLALYHSLNLLYRNTVKALAAAIDAKDAYTHGHSCRVAKYSVSIGKQLSLDPSELSDLEIAAYMHDLGKIGVPETILGKRGKLSAREFEEIKKHPALTNKILEPIDLPEFIVNATMQHHERLDGRGYPLGLKGDSISLFARIIAVADVFDALTSARPYRDAMTVEDALTILCEGIDSEFDRNVVHAFISALRRKTGDRDLATVYSELKFTQLNQMNQFLEKLTQYLNGAPVRLTHRVPARLSGWHEHHLPHPHHP